MASPNIPQGTLNRLKTSLNWADFPALNVSPPYLGKQSIHIAFNSKATTFIETQTGAVTSGEPYQRITITVHLLKTQALAPAYKAQIESSTLLGDGTLWADVQTGQGLTPYQVTNCAIEDVQEITMDGLDAGWTITIGGYYSINSSLYN